MKKWLSTIVFLVCLLFSYPLKECIDKIPGLSSRAFNITIVICIVVYIWYIVSSVYEMKHGEPRTLLLQALVVEIPILLIQILLLLLVSVVGLMNLVAAVVTLPVAYFLIWCFNCVLGFAGTMRGISGVVVAKREGLITVSASIVHGILQFIPVVNIIDCIVLRVNIKKQKVS